MLVYLDAGENIKGSPNENFGREILELFTMGVGNYTETDIREAARAFTGWTNDGLRFVVKPELHDDGQKTFLGRSGNFDGVEIIDIILEQPVTARFIAAKLYRYFVHDDPSAELIAELGKRFQEGGYDIGDLLRTIFVSRDFYSSSTRPTSPAGKAGGVGSHRPCYSNGAILPERCSFPILPTFSRPTSACRS